MNQNKPEHLEGMKKIKSPHLAIDYAIKGIKQQMNSDEYWNSLSKEELITEIKNLKAEQASQNENNEADVRDIIDLLTTVTWEKERTKTIIYDKNEVLSPFYGLLNTIIADFKELSEECTNLKADFL